MERVRSRTWYLLASFLLVLAMVAAGCGGDDGGSTGGDGEDSSELTKLKVADVAPLYLGMNEGFFEEGLEIVPALAEGGAAIVPAVMSRDDQIGFSNTTSLIIARSQDLPVQIICQGVQGGTGEDNAWDAVLVPKGSDITSAEDLAGKTIAVNTLNNLGPLTINTALDNRGVDYERTGIPASGRRSAREVTPVVARDPPEGGDLGRDAAPARWTGIPRRRGSSRGLALVEGGRW